MLSDDPSRNQNFMKPYQDFGVRRASDFINWLLPQGAWARCLSCQDQRRGGRGVLGKEYGKMGKDYGKLVVIVDMINEARVSNYEKRLG